MSKSVKICMAVIAVIFVFALITSVIIFNRPESQFVSVVQDNEILYKFNLTETENQTIKIDDGNGGFNIVEIADGKIRISDADCPDKVCVNTGFLSGDVPIVCLPHKLVIRYSYENENQTSH